MREAAPSLNSIFERAAKSARLAWLVAAVCLTVDASAYGAESVRPSTALADYVGAKDDSFSFKVRRREKLGDSDVVELSLVSQTWRDSPWKHQLFILRPSNAQTSKHALLFIGGGRWRPELEAEPKAEEKLPGEVTLLASAAAAMGTPICVLTHVPHQPLFGDMVEDEIISYTFEKFYETKDPTWPALLPMTKSAVRGMDAVQQYCQSEWAQPIETFTLTGASKRGWTTWLTAAVDPRVRSLAPMVIDVLNMAPQMKHQVESFGGYSEEIGDYTEKGLQDLIGSDDGKTLRQIVDPFSYANALKQDKLIILGTNDRYWPVDALNLYWDGLQGPKHILYCPNQGHGIKDYARVLGGVVALQKQTTGEQPFPKLSWNHEASPQGLHIRWTCDQPIVMARVWVANSPTRDFREAKWKNIDLSDKDGDFEYTSPPPESGFAAQFGEVQLKGDPFPAYFSTTLRVISAETKGLVEPNVTFQN